MRDAVREQLVEPVGVHHLVLTQIVVHGLLRVGQTEVARSGVIFVHQVVHLTEDAARRGAVARHERQETVVLHLAIDRHLLLRVHDVELRVAGLQSHGVFTRIADLRCACLTTLGGDDNHTGHCARTIYRGGTTVLQNLERLDVVRVQTGNGRRYQRGSVARRQLVGIHLGHVFHNHAVDHPQGFRRTVDRRSTADAYLRSGTKGS